MPHFRNKKVSNNNKAKLENDWKPITCPFHLVKLMLISNKLMLMMKNEKMRKKTTKFSEERLNTLDVHETIFASLF